MNGPGGSGPRVLEPINTHGPEIDGTAGYKLYRPVEDSVEGPDGESLSKYGLVEDKDVKGPLKFDYYSTIDKYAREANRAGWNAGNNPADHENDSGDGDLHHKYDPPRHDSLQIPDNRPHKLDDSRSGAFERGHSPMAGPSRRPDEPIPPRKPLPHSLFDGASDPDPLHPVPGPPGIEDPDGPRPNGGRPRPRPRPDLPVIDRPDIDTPDIDRPDIDMPGRFKLPNGM